MMFGFAETVKGMTVVEILNYYRNLYYAEPQVTERGIVANAINDYMMVVKHLCPCDVCAYNPPSSGDGKPCSICPAVKKEEQQ